MLAFESAPHHEQPYMQALSMEARMHPHLNSLDADGLNAFEAYSTYPSDPYPFVVRQSSFSLDGSNSKNLPKAPSPVLSAPHSVEQPSSSSSARSAHSGPPSSPGSPHQENWKEMDPGSAGLDGYSHVYGSTSIDQASLYAHAKLPEGFIDPSLIQPIHDHGNYPPPASYPAEPQYCYAASPVYHSSSPQQEFQGYIMPAQPQQHLQHDQQHHHHEPLHHPHEQQHPQHPLPHSQPQIPQQHPYIHDPSHQFPAPVRRSSVSSAHSKHSPQSPNSGNVELDEESRETHRCPHPDCGRVFRDLKAHMLTHQSERPEKCPIVTCEYHFKGFARKYDKNRHTLTHYKGTMVCGFCPGSGSAAEKSFNRADVFKRHLTSVHGVDQSAPNCRKKSPSASAAKLENYCQDATGKCSTCGSTFDNAQDFYEHLDDCVLRVVQQEEPSEAINQKLLNEVASDGAVKETMERHMLTEPALDMSKGGIENDDNKNDNHSSSHRRGASKASSLMKSGPIGPCGVTKSRPAVSRRRNNRNNYPPSWGCPTNKMKMKRRMLCLYDGPRRIWKDEMMLDNEFEVRLKLPGNDDTGREAYVTDLDVETLKRAEGVLNATEEEKGPWVPTSQSNGLIGPAAVPVIGNPGENLEEVNIEELMS